MNVLFFLLPLSLLGIIFYDYKVFYPNFSHRSKPLGRTYQWTSSPAEYGEVLLEPIRMSELSSMVRNRSHPDHLKQLIMTIYAFLSHAIYSNCTKDTKVHPNDGGFFGTYYAWQLSLALSP